MSSAAYGTAIALAVLAVGALAIATRSAAGRMSIKGPGIRTVQTLSSLEAWRAGQRAAAPLYRYVAAVLASAAALALVLGALDAPGWLTLLAPAAIALAGAVFFFGVATVRANKAAAATLSVPKRSAKRRR